MCSRSIDFEYQWCYNVTRKFLKFKKEEFVSQSGGQKKNECFQENDGADAGHSDAGFHHSVRW